MMLHLSDFYLFYLRCIPLYQWQGAFPFVIKGLVLCCLHIMYFYTISESCSSIIQIPKGLLRRCGIYS